LLDVSATDAYDYESTGFLMEEARKIRDGPPKRALGFTIMTRAHHFFVLMTLEKPDAMKEGS